MQFPGSPLVTPLVFSPCPANIFTSSWFPHLFGIHLGTIRCWPSWSAGHFALEGKGCSCLDSITYPGFWGCIRNKKLCDLNYSTCTDSMFNKDSKIWYKRIVDFSYNWVVNLPAETASHSQNEKNSCEFQDAKHNNFHEYFFTTRL